MQLGILSYQLSQGPGSVPKRWPALGGGCSFTFPPFLSREECETSRDAVLGVCISVGICWLNMHYIHCTLAVQARDVFLSSFASEKYF